MDCSFLRSELFANQNSSVSLRYASCPDGTFPSTTDYNHERFSSSGMAGPNLPDSRS